VAQATSAFKAKLQKLQRSQSSLGHDEVMERPLVKKILMPVKALFIDPEFMRGVPAGV
jgi:hypothetical protein